MNRLVDDVVKQHSLCLMPPSLVRERLNKIRETCSLLYRIVGSDEAEQLYTETSPLESDDTMEQVEDMLALAMPQLLLLQDKVSTCFRGFVESSSSSGVGGAPRAMVPLPDDPTALNNSPAPATRHSVNLWQRARFSGVGQSHGNFSWISHRIVMGPLLLYKNSQGHIVDDARSLVAACVAKNCSMKLVISVCKDYVLTGKAFSVVPVSRVRQ